MTTGRYKAVYILYPRGSRTGGPEALHQLAAALRELGTPAFLVPFPQTLAQPRVSEYEHYDVPEADKVVDQPGNAVVSPENHYFGLAKYRRVDRFCWWLSIDNSQLFGVRRLDKKSKAGFRTRLSHSPKRVFVKWVRPLAMHMPVHHLAQSAYASNFLHSVAHVPSTMLSDYISLPISSADKSPDRNPRQIAFNFTKGGHLVQQVINSRAVDARWVPIQHMDREEVIRTLRSSAIYLDLGHQPGKDRLPREAAASGAVTLVARRGAGKSSLDFPLPHDHKIIADNSVTESASVALNKVLADLSHQYARQETFRRAIELERQIFMKEVQRIFIEGRLGADLGTGEDRE